MRPSSGRIAPAPACWGRPDRWSASAIACGRGFRAHALAEAARHAAILLLPGADGTARQMRLMPAGLPATAPAVLLAADPGPGWRPPAGLVAQAMGLTRVQGELLSWLCTGLGTVELCARLRVSPHTLRAHLSLLLARTGAANRAALIAQVMQRVMPLLLVGAPPVTTEAAEFLPGNQSEELMT
jgi:DNA-binding CsgD family transcriptional regulator